MSNRDVVVGLVAFKEYFIGEVAQEAVACTERKWQRKFKQFKEVA